MWDMVDDMATYNVAELNSATLTSTTPDTVNITNAWDAIEVENLAASTNLTVQIGDNTNEVVVPAGRSKVFRPASVRGAGVVGGTGSTALHKVVVTGDGNAYSVAGIR